MSEQLGNRGLTTVRRLNKDRFESLFGENLGFDSAFLCFSEHAVWGAGRYGVRVLEVFLELDKVEHSYIIDRTSERPSLVINSEYMDRISWLFWTFYNPEHNHVLTRNSDLAIALDGAENFDWNPPVVIAMYLNFNIDGEPQVFPIMDNSSDWDQDEEPVEFEDAGEYIQYCGHRYSAFLEEYSRAFDEDGNPRS